MLKTIRVKLLGPLKSLPQGYYRILMVGWILIPIIIGFTVDAMGAPADEGWETWFLGTILYYVLARLGVWVYEGFKREQIK